MRLRPSRIPATSPIETFASTVTRAADNISLYTSAFPYSSTEGTIVAVWTPTTFQTATSPFSLSDGSAANLIEVTRASATIARFQVRDANVFQAQIDAGTLTATNRTAIAYKANDFAISLNGGTVVTDTSGTVPTAINVLGVGSRAGTIQLNGRISSLLYVPRRDSNADLPTFGA